MVSDTSGRKQRTLMRTMKFKTDNGIIVCILPKMDDTKKIYSGIKYVNSAMENVAHQEGLNYANTEDEV